MVKDMAKLIHLPLDVIKVLSREAKANRTRTKPYMEKVLIDHSEKLEKEKNKK